MPKQKRAKKNKKNFIPRLGLALIILGLILIFIPGIFYFHQTIQLTFFAPEVTQLRNYSEKESPKPLPVHLSIPAINTSLPIGETTLSRNVWGIYQNGVSHLTISARPGEKGPIILYAHNTIDRFGSLPYLPPGQKIMITTDDKTIHTYVVIERFETDPDRVDLFAKDEETLILYTCSGFADLKRFVVIAEPLETTLP